MRTQQFVIAQRRLDGKLEYLDTTEPDTWTLNRRAALRSTNDGWLKTLMESRPNTILVPLNGV